MIKQLKKTFVLFVSALLVLAFALTSVACKKDDDKAMYEVKFVTYGGSVIQPTYVEEGKTLTRPADPTYEGYKFVNWFENATLEGDAYDFSAAVTKSFTLYAKWQKKGAGDTGDTGEDDPNTEKFTVTLDFNYDNKTEEVSVAKGGVIPADKLNATRTGYNLNGWYTDKTYSAASLFNLSTPITKALTIYANWISSTALVDGNGLNLTNYWDGTADSIIGGDGFTFDKTESISGIGDIEVVPPPTSATGKCLVRFDSMGGDSVDTQSVNSGDKAVKPTSPEKNGYMFTGWYEDNSCSTPFDFSAPVNASKTVYAGWAQLPAPLTSVIGYQESIGINMEGKAQKCEYQLKGASGWTEIDAELIRDGRIDIVGLKAGEYNVKVTVGGSAKSLPSTVTVDAQDRSGYAHFKYTDGIGAYKDDGTLKDNAIVIYLTDDNKDTVMGDLVDSGKYSDLQMFKIPGSSWNNKDADGIGWWLNNAQYSKTTSSGEKGNTWAANGNSLGFKTVMATHPVVIRVLGTVTTPEGCTAYDSLNEGGSVGDNGHMARMRNYNDITIEGIGEDASIYGWGFHFMTGSDATGRQGTSFEVRNLTFDKYPEDAIGMEGVQEGGRLTGTVARCWIHNNVFLPGYCANPAESDKKEGDGSCDFKRGEYYTLSYNYFEYCHKTNLIGSSDSSLQYNITMHHNMWYNCGSRIPLLRQANLHFYNNYVFADATDSKADLSYVHSLRANCYLFSEGNYYDGCKQVTDGKGSSAKSYNNMFYACFSTNNMTKVASRDVAVANNCQKYDGTKLDKFDTDPNLFYYDAVNKKTKALVDDPVTARTRVMMYVGANGFEKIVNSITPSNTPSSAVTVTASAPVTVDLTSSTGAINGVKIINSKAGKGKGIILTFKLASDTQVTVTGNGSGDSCPELVDEYGRVWASKFSGTFTEILPEGVYFVASGQKDKEATISSVKFEDTGASSEARITAAKAALTAIPSTISINDEGKITAAEQAYSALASSERDQIEAVLYQNLLKAREAYNKLAVEYVIARIDYIGTVDKTSYLKINAAEIAYSKLYGAQQAKVTNYDKLVKAQETYASFAVDNVISRLEDLPDLTNAVILKTETYDKVKKWFDAVDSAFNNLSYEEGNGQQGEVLKHNNGATYKKLTDGLAELVNVKNYIEFKNILDEATVETAGKDGGKLSALYNTLADKQKAYLSTAETAKYDGIKAAYAELARQNVTAVYDFASNSFKNKNEGGVQFTLTGGNGKDYSKDKEASKRITVNGVEYKYGVEFNSGSEIKFTLEAGAKKILRIYSSNVKEYIINGTKYKSASVSGDGYSSNCCMLEVEITGTGEEIVIGRSGTPIIFLIELVNAE